MKDALFWERSLCGGYFVREKRLCEGCFVFGQSHVKDALCLD